MNESRLQITLSLSESVVERVDELLLETGMQSRGALVDCLLREVLFDKEQPQVTQHFPNAS
jgi:metal-responsive CopG/Arc/MetJ family transcriptional regulator